MLAKWTDLMSRYHVSVVDSKSKCKIYVDYFNEYAFYKAINLCAILFITGEASNTLLWLISLSCTSVVHEYAYNIVPSIAGILVKFMLIWLLELASKMNRSYKQISRICCRFKIKMSDLFW